MSEFWNARWGEANPAYGDAPNAFLEAHAAALPAGGTVVCLADGDGRNGTWLAARGWDVLGVDSSAVGVARALARGVPGYRTSVADLATWSFPPCDGVVSIYAHLPPPLRAEVHARAWAALRPGGVFLLEAFNPRQRARGLTSGGPHDPALLFTLEQLRTDVPGARFEVLEEVETTLAEGDYHVGLAEVVRMVARR
jgi:SAM-dependent methyltransferase